MKKMDYYKYHYYIKKYISSVGNMNILDHFSGMNFLIGFIVGLYTQCTLSFVSAFRDSISLQMTISFLYFQKHSLYLWKVCFHKYYSVISRDVISSKYEVLTYLSCPRNVSGLVSLVISPQVFLTLESSRELIQM